MTISKNKTNNAAKNTSGRFSGAKKVLALLQRIGKALLFPIAMLPLAAIFLRLSAGVFPSNTEFSTVINGIMGAVGNGVFDNLPALFAVGVAFGLAKDNRGEAAIVGFLAFMILQGLILDSKLDLIGHIYSGVDLGGTGHGDAFHKVFSAPATSQAGGFKDSYNAILINNVIAGITIGGVVAFVYNKFSGLEMPSVLGFFSGRRLIPVLGMMAAVAVGILWALIFPWIGLLLYYFSKALTDATGNRWANASVMGIYGVINRLLIPFGLHHVPNTLFWFSSLGGSMTNHSGAQIDGDIFMFLNGDITDIAGHANTSGTFQAGFFPIMMFGLPAIAVAMWSKAKGQTQKARVASLFAGSAIVSFFTGITEPIEFSFMFLAPVLFGFHALMTGVVGFIVGAMGIQIGFGFSAGLIDYVLSIPKSLDLASAKGGFSGAIANPLWIWPIGILTSIAYFFGARFLINKFNLDTPGRGTNLILDDAANAAPIREGDNKYTADCKVIIKAVGGKGNIKSLGNCATRLRFVLKDNSKVTPADFKKTKAMGSMKVAGGYQVIMGPTVEMFANEIDSLLAATTVKKTTVKKTVAKKTTTKKATTK